MVFEWITFAPNWVDTIFFSPESGSMIDWIRIGTWYFQCILEGLEKEELNQLKWAVE